MPVLIDIAKLDGPSSLVPNIGGFERGRNEGSFELRSQKSICPDCRAARSQRPPCIKERHLTSSWMSTARLVVTAVFFLQIWSTTRRGQIHSRRSLALSVSIAPFSGRGILRCCSVYFFASQYQTTGSSVAFRSILVD